MGSTTLNQYAYYLSGTNYFCFLISRVKIPFTKVLSPPWSTPNTKESDDVHSFSMKPLVCQLECFALALSFKSNWNVSWEMCLFLFCSLIIVYHSATTLVSFSFLYVFVVFQMYRILYVCILSHCIFADKEKMKVLFITGVKNLAFLITISWW